VLCACLISAYELVYKPWMDRHKYGRSHLNSYSY